MHKHTKKTPRNPNPNLRRLEPLEPRQLLTSTGTIEGHVKILSSGTPMPGVTVYTDLNNNGIHDPGESASVTSSTGEFTVTAPIGVVVHVREIVPDGFEEFAPDVNTISEISPLIGFVTGELFFNSPEKLALQQQPADTAVAATLNPITINIEKTNGTLDTSATGNITLSLTNSNTTLRGTLTLPITQGTATFNDLSIDTPGNYTLTATTQGLSLTSHAFSITTGKLVFLNPPKNAAVNQPFSPALQIAVENGKGKILTTNDGATITIAAIGVNGSHTTGNTATLVDGIATFNSLKIDTPGSFVLQASDGQDTDAGTKPFKVVGDHLVIQNLPKSANANSPITPPIDIFLENSKNQIVSNNTDQIQWTLNATGISPLVTFTTLINGHGTISNLTLPTGANYTAKAVDFTSLLASNGNSNPIADATASIQILGLHVAFLKPPKTLDVFATTNPPLIAMIENSKNKILTDNTDNLLLTFTPTAGSSVSFNALCNNGIATFQNITLNNAGNYSLKATDLTSLIAANPNPNPVADALTSIQILPLHLVIRNLTKSIAANTPLIPQLQVLIENKKNKVITTNTDHLLLTYSPSPTPDTAFSAICIAGIATFQNLTFPTPGTLTLNLQDLTAAITAGNTNSVLTPTTTLKIT